MQKLDWGIFADDQLLAATATEVRAKSWARDLLGKNGWEVRKIADEPCRTLAGLVEEFYADAGLAVPDDLAALDITAAALTALIAGQPDSYATRRAVGMMMLGLVSYAAAIGTDPVACLIEHIEAQSLT